MTMRVIIISFILTIYSFSCAVHKQESYKDQDNASVKFQNEHTVKGKIHVEVDQVVSMFETNKFLKDLGLEIADSTRFKELHFLIINVPIGQERKWVELLKQYSIIKDADILSIMH
jgi:hypothetical protein